MCSMIPRPFKPATTILLAAMLTALLAAGCAPSHHRYPAAVDYDQLDRKMASLRSQGVYGRTGFDEAIWAELERRHREAQAYLRRRAFLMNDPGVDILLLVSAAELLILAQREALRQEALKILARVEEYEAFQRLSRERRKQAALKRYAKFGQYVPQR